MTAPEKSHVVAGSAVSTSLLVNSNTDTCEDLCHHKHKATTGVVLGNKALVSDTSKKIRRAERFGTKVNLSEEEKLNCRAARFGIVKKSEELKMKLRAERFGTLKKSEELKMKARAQRFGISGSLPKISFPKKEDNQDRSIRTTTQTPSSSSSMPLETGKMNAELKAAIVGRPGGVAR